MDKFVNRLLSVFRIKQTYTFVNTAATSSFLSNRFWILITLIVFFRVQQQPRKRSPESCGRKRFESVYKRSRIVSRSQFVTDSSQLMIPLALFISVPHMFYRFIEYPDSSSINMSMCTYSAYLVLIIHFYLSLNCNYLRFP